MAQRHLDELLGFLEKRNPAASDCLHVERAVVVEFHGDCEAANFAALVKPVGHRSPQSIVLAAQSQTRVGIRMGQIDLIST
jgi:hypothetical protein